MDQKASIDADSARHQVIQADFYVATNGNDQWSGRLATPNADRTDGPFATLGKARDAVRQVVKADGGLNRDLTVLVRGGIYRLIAPVEFGVDDSGTAEHAITFAALPGERPILSGGAPVTGWTPWKGDIVRSVSPSGKGVNQLFCDGQAMIRARYPNLDPADPITKGWLYMRDVPGTDRGSRAPLARQGFIYQPGDIPEWKDLTGAEVSAYSWTDYTHDVSPLASIDRDKQQVNLTRQGSLAFKPRNRYFFQNLLEELDQPGEYYSSPKTSELYLWPRNPGDLDKVTVPVASALLEVKGDGAAGRWIRNLHFRGITFMETLGSACVLSGIARCSITDSLFTNIGGTGIDITLDAEDNLLAGNELGYIGLDAISFNGYPPGGKDACTRNVVRNNHIHHCGRVLKAVTGIRFNNASHTIVENNLIHDMSFSGIAWGGGAMLKYYTESGKQPWAFPSNKINGIEVTRENIKSFIQGRDNLVQKNHVYNCCLEVSDGGAINSWAPGVNNTVRNNLVHDVVGFSATGPDKPHFLAMGIYLDDESDESVVEGNVVYRVSNYGILIHNAIGNTVRNNAVADCGNALITFVNETKRPGDNLVEGNIASCPDWPTDLIHIVPDLPAHIRSDRNLCFSGTNPPRFRCTGAMTLEQWQASGKDTHSIMADPRFADAADGNFALAKNSPAYRLGWQAIDVSDVGLLNDWGRRPETAEGRAARVDGPKQPPFFSRAILKARALAEGETGRPSRCAVITRTDKALDSNGTLADWPETARATPLVLQQNPSGAIGESQALAFVARDAGNLYVAVEADLLDLSVLETDPAKSVWGQTYGAEVCFRADPKTVHVLHGFASGRHELSADAGASPERIHALTGQYEYAARVDGKRWVGTWKIPLQAAGLDPARAAQARFNVGLFDRARHEWLAWVGARGPNWQVDNAGTLVLQPVVPGAAPNLILNPACDKQAGKEPWYEDGWDTGNAPPEKKALVSFADEGRHGASCLKIVGRDAVAMDSILALWRQKILNPVPGTYRLSYWVKTEKLSAAALDAGVGAYGYLRAADGVNGEYLSREDGWIESKNLPWERREILLTVSPGFPELWITFGMRKATGTVWIDDVRLEKCE
ncbi:MAG: hypothetical protein A3K19_22125 [Lentisphaerae bacterium RIFOXYB12_FULL_65_16]|nr:MAG: hypothetical protein A3K18_21445 [Lentisphaerae bacterium RIFOXYA12_64_32]OGV93559.1 MAG: hypothetical protein A3K19_22125 [Lentisphaerae bacterium RIFOXYB12_FULL_65_16]